MWLNVSDKTLLKVLEELLKMYDDMAPDCRHESGAAPYENGLGDIAEMDYGLIKWKGE